MPRFDPAEAHGPQVSPRSDEYEYNYYGAPYNKHDRTAEHSKEFCLRYHATVTPKQIAQYERPNLVKWDSNNSLTRTSTVIAGVDIVMTEQNYQTLLHNLDQARLDYQDLKRLRSLTSAENAEQARAATLRKNNPALELAWQRYQLILNTVS